MVEWLERLIYSAEDGGFASKLGQPASGKLSVSTAVSGCINLSNQGRVMQRKERNGLCLFVPKMQRAFYPHCSYGEQAMGNRYHSRCKPVHRKQWLAFNLRLATSPIGDPNICLNGIALLTRKTPITTAVNIFSLFFRENKT